jgi:hypothetical protein
MVMPVNSERSRSKMNVKQFINQVFLNEYRRLIYDYGFHYISFSLIALGIELLGACLDEHDFGKRNESSRRFRRAIENLFPPEYQRFNSGDYDLCTNLRNGFAHQFRPGSMVGLTHRDESRRLGTKHLQIHNDKLVLVSEDLYEDFVDACKKVVRRIDNGVIPHPKVYSSFLSVPQDKSSLAGELDLSTKTDLSVGSAITEGFPWDVDDTPECD